MIDVRRRRRPAFTLARHTQRVTAQVHRANTLPAAAVPSFRRRATLLVERTLPSCTRGPTCAAHAITHQAWTASPLACCWCSTWHTLTQSSRYTSLHNASASTMPQATATVSQSHISLFPGKRITAHSYASRRQAPRRTTRPIGSAASTTSWARRPIGWLAECGDKPLEILDRRSLKRFKL